MDRELLDELSKLDCGDNSCFFTKNRTGWGTNGGCRCLDNKLPKTLKLAIKKYYFLKGEK